MSGQTSGVVRSVLLVGGELTGDAGVRRGLQCLGVDAVLADDVDRAMQIIASDCCDLIIAYQAKADTEVEDFIGFVRGTFKQPPPVIVIAETPAVEQAVRAIRRGACDYVPAPLDEPKLRQMLEGIGRERSQTSRRKSRYFCPECPPGVPLAGHSEAIVKRLEMIRLVAESRCHPILILGETGTGKELAAQAVHAWRCGPGGNLVAVNCAALTAGLLESELFGHVKGAFTGADREKTGLFEVAAEGSIFLDEISEMPMDLQAKLLRVLQEKTFRKVGGTQDLPCKATIIASSNRQLARLVREGRFRKDLYFRLGVFPITVPALRDPQRRQDIPLLAEYFLEACGVAAGQGPPGMGEIAVRRLMDHDWPGNVRELRNVIERAVILERSGLVGPDSLVFDSLGEADAEPDGAAPVRRDFSLEAAEREFIVRAMKETGWQRTRAAALLGITRATLHAKLKRYDIKVPLARLPEESPAEDPTHPA